MAVLTPERLEEGRHGHADVGDAVEVVEHGAHRQDAVGVAHDGFDDVNAGHADGVVGCALAVDDLVGGVLDVLVNLLTNRSASSGA